MNYTNLNKLYKKESKLHKKIMKLETFLNNLDVCKAQEIGMTQQYLLNCELSAMKTYHLMLVTRIDVLEFNAVDMSDKQYEDFIKEYIKKQG